MNRIKPSSKRWGIVVGVDKYANANEFLCNLQGCVIDAHKMCDTMTNADCCGFLQDHVRLLENPCFDELEEAFADIGTQMSAGDELWFYFAGHGYSDRSRPRDNGYLLLTDARYDKRGFLRSEGSVSRYQLGDLVGQHIKADGVTVVFFLDCCCAASVGLNTGDRAVQESTELEDVAASFWEMGGRNLSYCSCDDEMKPMQLIRFFATGKHGRAHEDRDGGAFTKRLVEGLLGGTAGHPTTSEDTDIYVTAGALSLYVSAKTSAQGPKQDFSDPLYPLSISPEKKKARDHISALDCNVVEWLTTLKGCVHEKQFAERVMERVEDFKFAGVMRNVLRLVSDPNRPTTVKGDAAANLLKAFFTLRNLMERTSFDGSSVYAGINGGKDHARKTMSPSTLESSADRTPLTSRDRELLEDVEERLHDIDGDEVDLCEIGRKAQPAAAAALDVMARKRMRQMCGRQHYNPLYTPNEQAAWSMKARKGFSSVFEAAVYELVRDDKALALRKR